MTADEADGAFGDRNGKLFWPVASRGGDFDAPENSAMALKMVGLSVPCGFRKNVLTFSYAAFSVHPRIAETCCWTWPLPNAES